MKSLIILLRAVPIEESGVEMAVLLVEKEIGGKEVETALTELRTSRRTHTGKFYIPVTI